MRWSLPPSVPRLSDTWERVPVLGRSQLLRPNSPSKKKKSEATASSKSELPPALQPLFLLALLPIFQPQDFSSFFHAVLFSLPLLAASFTCCLPQTSLSLSPERGAPEQRLAAYSYHTLIVIPRVSRDSVTPLLFFLRSCLPARWNERTREFLLLRRFVVI